MRTDWQQICEMMNTAIDSCEKIELAGFNESYRSAVVTINGVDNSVAEFLISAWTLPENLRYQIIHGRHAAGVDSPYVPEAARILTAMVQACSELIGAADQAPAAKAIAGMNHWYSSYAVPNIVKAIHQAKDAEPSS
ncbi:hypothetical protein [Pseudomonas sp. PS01301]|uniref:hypothetical protein n=1 Tax=Pseudomonas sp. PS01301 TaxID=2991437 RepID=UPI00249A5B19|nr:hypothetical protein [Pseudomonas sp. PS01301]